MCGRKKCDVSQSFIINLRIKYLATLDVSKEGELLLEKNRHFDLSRGRINTDISQEKV